MTDQDFLTAFQDIFATFIEPLLANLLTFFVDFARQILAAYLF